MPETTKILGVAMACADWRLHQREVDFIARIG